MGVYWELTSLALSASHLPVLTDIPYMLNMYGTPAVASCLLAPGLCTTPGPRRGGAESCSGMEQNPRGCLQAAPGGSQQAAPPGQIPRMQRVHSPWLVPQCAGGPETSACSQAAHRRAPCRAYFSACSAVVHMPAVHRRAVLQWQLGPYRGARVARPQKGITTKRYAQTLQPGHAPALLLLQRLEMKRVHQTQEPGKCERSCPACAVPEVGAIRGMQTADKKPSGSPGGNSNPSTVCVQGKLLSPHRHT